MKYLLIAFIGFIACQSPANNTGATNDTASIAQSDTTTPNNSTADTTTLNGNWYLIPVMASDTAAGKLAQLNFSIDEKKFTGNSGCNSMSGNFQLTDSSLVFNERIMLTKMACIGYNEQAFIENLLRTNNYTFDNGVLILRVGETELSRWSRTPANTPKANRV